MHIFNSILYLLCFMQQMTLGMLIGDMMTIVFQSSHQILNNVKIW